MYPEKFDDFLITGIDTLEALSEHTQVACCLHMLEAQVNNGGFHQYFRNSSGLFVIQTLEALSKIGAVKTRVLLNQAVGIAYKSGYPTDPTKHEVELIDDDSVYDLLEPLEQEFYAYAEPLSDMVNSYLSKNTLQK